MFELKTLYSGNLPWLVDNTIIFAKAGSHSYGLATPSSDFDFKGVAIAPKEYLLGYLQKFEQAERKKQNDEIEFTIYEIRKFFNLAANANPNILEMLWLDPEDYLILTAAGQAMVDAKQLFLSKKAVYAYCGYAISQLKRIKSHRAFLLNPPVKEPQREDFGLPKDKALITSDQRGAMEELISKNLITEQDLSENFLYALSQEKKYFQAKRYWDQYQEWKTNRNPKRAELEAKYSYDAKHAMHLVRLMVQCKEILEQQKLIVKRKEDREFLLGIRNGAWSYDELIEWAEKQEVYLMESAETSSLPKEPDRKKLDDLCVSIIHNFIFK